jgi:uncharacterized membrane-anchored protein YhcB (DUF1043 family)
MRRLMVILGLVIFVVVIIVVVPLSEEQARTKEQVMKSQQEIIKKQQQLDDMVFFKETKVLKSAQYYANFMNDLNHRANTYGLKANLEVIEATGKNLMNKEKTYAGINVIKFKLTFYQVVEMMRILQTIDAWQKDFPIRISSIEYKDKYCQITGGIYGL